jgi:hypothetical protein
VVTTSAQPQSTDAHLDSRTADRIEQTSGSKRLGVAVVGGIVILCLVGAFLNDQPGTRSSAPEQPALSYNSSPAPLQNTPPATTDYRDPAGRTYRVPDWVHRELLAKKSSIDAQEASLNSLKSEVEALGKEIEGKRLNLDQTSQYTVDAFNREVDRYNPSNRQLPVTKMTRRETESLVV